MRVIAIHSAPRSGSTWLGSIFDSDPGVTYKFQPLFSYAFKSYLSETSTSRDIDSFFLKLKESNDAFINQIEAKKKGIIPTFQKAHSVNLVYKEVRYHYLLPNILEQKDNFKLICLVRNPFSVLNSWRKAPKEFKPTWNFDKEWYLAPSKNLSKKEEYNGYVKWKESCLLFLELSKLYSANVKIVEYKDLLANTMSTVERIFQFAELDISKQTVDYIKRSTASHDHHPYSVFKKKLKDDDWRTELPESVIDLIKRDLKDSPLFKYLT